MSQFIDSLAQIKAERLMRFCRRHIEQYMGVPNEFNKNLAELALNALLDQLKRVPVPEIERELETLLNQFNKWREERAERVA